LQKPLCTAQRADSFRQKRSIDPLYTGGAVAATSDGSWLFSTLSDDVVITNVRTGHEVARLTGVRVFDAKLSCSSTHVEELRILW
jgi:hypothetical protein